VSSRALCPLYLLKKPKYSSYFAMPPKKPKEPRESDSRDDGNKDDKNDSNGSKSDKTGKGGDTGTGRTTRSKAKKNEDEQGSKPGEGPPRPTEEPPAEQRKINVGSYRIQDFRTGSLDDIEWHRSALEADLRRRRDAAAADPDSVRANLLERDRLYAELCKKKKGAVGIVKLRAELQKQVAKCEAAGSNPDRNRKYATALYEDFMYYQNPRNRKAYFKKTKRKTKAEDFLAGRVGKTGVIQGLTSDDHYNQQADPYVRGMRHSHVGVAKRLQRRAVFQELHVHTPRPDQQMTGLGRPPFRPVPPLELKLDTDQIEARRLEVESRTDDETANLEYTTHDERRTAQAQMAALTKSNKGLERIRTTGGAFLAANERSKYWPTSYDCLGIVSGGRLPNIAAIDDTEVDDMPDADGFVANVDEENETPISPDEVFEFVRLKRPQPEYQVENMLMTTGWSEASMGRREWHEHHHLPPPSEVGSPPLAAQAEIHLDTVPDVLNLHVLTSAERETYRDRLEDHYGMLEDNWPRTGLRVPYDPESFDHVRNPSQENVGWVHPLLKGPVDLRKWEGKSDGGDYGDDLESDDEGDLFRNSYLECSRAPGGAANPSGGGADGEESKAPTE
jgi:hypothetical protein